MSKHWFGHVFLCLLDDAGAQGLARKFGSGMREHFVFLETHEKLTLSAPAFP